MKYVITPVMGTVIGYGTNYIAVKMLFRPRNEVKILGHTLPFTPGAIPKGQPRLAKAIGNVVGNTLITKDDIKSKLMNETIQDTVIGKISEILNAEIKSEVMTVGKLDEEGYAAVKAKISDTVTEQILTSINDVGVDTIISNECEKVVKEKIQNPMLKMFLNDDFIASITKMIGDEVQKYIDKNGYFLIEKEVNKKLDVIEAKSVSELLHNVDITEEKIQSSVAKLYSKSVDKALDELFSRLDISKMIEDKINAMDMNELETLVLKVMKKELDTIVNLGAVIGLIMGLINMAINIFL
ncbi:MAG: DUF445 family protein [Clostridia bacterium]|nr:DUF445 family protein [Clostridia bacterium]